MQVVLPQIYTEGVVVIVTTVVSLLLWATLVVTMTQKTAANSALMTLQVNDEMAMM